MALTLLTGRTGTGKSYEAVSRIVHSLGQNKKVFTNIYINIEDENYHYYDELELKKFLFYIETTFKDVENLDTKKEELKNSIYFESDFFIDEAHLVGFRDKKESILNWCTLHRHFNQNITVITQVPSNLHRDYLMMFHSHIDMIPQKRRLSKDHMGYKEYDGYKGDEYPTKHFKPNLEIFNIYGSGNKELGSSPLVKKVVMLFFALGVGLILIIFMLSSLFDSPFQQDETNTTKVTKVDNTKINDFGLTEKDIQDINQTIEEVICYTDVGCYYQGIRYTYKKFLLYVLPKHYETEKTLLASSSKFKMYKYALKK